MHRAFCAASLAIGLMATPALAVEYITYGPTMLSASVSGLSDDHKRQLDARSAAASFIASGGTLRDAQLEQALLDLRRQQPMLQQASDLELARALLAQP